MLNQTTTLVRTVQATRRVIGVAVSVPEKDSVADAADRRLRDSGYFEVRELSCEHHEGVLVLRGQVSSWDQKQLAQEVVRHLPGVEAIINVVDVVASSQSERRSSTLTNGSDAFPIGKQSAPQMQAAQLAQDMSF